jgi:antitoxin protein of toxin-antitoxin system
MGIFDKAKDALSEHSEHADTGIEKAGDLVDEKTGNKYAEHVDKGQDFATERVREYAAEDQPEPPA